ncbi:unnamed protein product [Moneuplotes crassus]|uniref:Photolyase/cryptochrome alpha/beta domain-containing protein n=1 Tax=Euplotes crassus TaxID=5936 RepID=A0AAD1Y764_EUPCR|nr:unnamed protein product [Moneuplotes crassus]
MKDPYLDQDEDSIEQPDHNKTDQNKDAEESSPKLSKIDQIRKKLASIKNGEHLSKNPSRLNFRTYSRTKPTATEQMLANSSRIRSKAKRVLNVGGYEYGIRVESRDKTQKKRKRKEKAKRADEVKFEENSDGGGKSDTYATSIEELKLDDRRIRVIVFLDNYNLRLDDNLLLKTAIDVCKNTETYEIIPVFCLVPKQSSESDDESLLLSDQNDLLSSRGILGTYFLLESAKELKSALQNFEIPSNLIITLKPPQKVLTPLLHPSMTNILITSINFNPPKIPHCPYQLLKIPSCTLYSLDSLPFPLASLPRLFSRFK